MNEQAGVTLFDEHVLLVSEKQHWLSSRMHQYHFALSEQSAGELVGCFQPNIANECGEFSPDGHDLK